MVALTFKSLDEILKHDQSKRKHCAVHCTSLQLTVYQVVQFFESSDEILIIQMKVIKQYFPVVLFIMLKKMVLTFESVDETLKRDHSNESY